MKIFFAWLGGLIGFFLLITFIAFLSNASSLAVFRFWEPKFENARREVYENTQSYVEGKRQELTKLHLEYLRDTTETGRAAIRYTVAQSFANFDDEKIESPTLQAWLKQCKGE